METMCMQTPGEGTVTAHVSLFQMHIGAKL